MAKYPYWFVNERGETDEYCYLIRFNKWLKIGYTTNLITRYNAIRFSLPEECKLIGYYKTHRAAQMEAYLLSEMSDYNSTRGEWVIYNEVLLDECIVNIFKNFHLSIIQK